MMKILVCTIALTAFGCAQKAVIDQAFTNADPAFHKTYAKPTKECIAASVSSLRDMKIGLEKQTDSELITERYNAYTYTSTSGSVSPAGFVAANTQVNNQQAKLYIQASPQGAGCKLQVARVRVWNNGREIEALDVEFTKRMAIAPLFSELDERLKN